MKKALLALFFVLLFVFTSYGAHLMDGESMWDSRGSGAFAFNLNSVSMTGHSSQRTAEAAGVTCDSAPAPLLKCVSVAANGDVTLSWVPDSDTSSAFKEFYIYYRQSLGGPYTLIDSVLNYAQTSYTHVGANANTTPAYYYIFNNSGCPNGNAASTSDTLRAIFLTVTNPGTGYADLNWNPTHTPPLSSNSLYYYIYKEYPAGVWTLVDSTTQLAYSDPITVCSAFISYRIEVSDSSGCTSVSNVDGKLFKGILVPAVPLLDSVSVNGAGLATISWQKDASGNVIGYIVYKSNGGLNVPIDTVYGINSLTLNSSVNATAQPDSFCVAALDSCDNNNTSPLSVIQNTIYLTGAFDICTNSVTLKWNPYINWPSGVLRYDIYASINGGAYSVIGSSTTTTYVQDSLIALSNYCYIVRAVDGTDTKTSASNSICITPVALHEPSFQYVRKATVLSDNSAFITAYVDTSADIISYNILRSVTPGGPYQVIGTLPFSGNPYISYTDLNVPVGQQSYYYKVIAIDSCGNDGFVSQYGRTIHTTANANANITNTIDWNDYEIWLGGVDHYNIYRNVDGVTNPVPIASIPFGQATAFTDNVSNLVYTSGKFCYYIQAVEGPGDIYGFVDTSYSNQACVIQQPMVFIPNAFQPDGINNIFAPFNSFINVQDFSFDIYNRWGEHIFHSDNPSFGWDGTYKGHDTAEGIYVYYATMQGTDGTTIVRKGTITLVR